MKNGIRRWLTLAFVPVVTIMMLGVAIPAHADHKPPTHVCDDEDDPLLPNVFTTTEASPFNGEIIINRTDGQDCLIEAADIHAELEIEIRVEGGGKLLIPNAANIRSLEGNVTLISTGNDIDAPNADIKADNLIEIQAGVEDGTAAGSIDTKDVISNFADITTGDMNILIRAQAGIDLGKVKTNGDLGVNSQRSGNVQIDANLHPSNNGDIAIGGGVGIEEIDIRSKTGGTDEFGNPDPFTNEIGMRVMNGADENSTGNITVNDLSMIKVTQTESRSGRLELNANGGELILGGGTLDSSSQNNFGGGNIYLFAEKITVTGAATIDNSQETTAPDITRQIMIAASTIDFSGGDLSVISDGNGQSDELPVTVYFLPAGGVISSSTDVLESLTHSVEFNGTFFQFPGEIHFNGGTTSNLEIRADGDHVQIAITGDDLIFDGNDVQIQTKGGKDDAKHEVVMGYFDFGSYDGTKGLEINNTGKFEIFARGEGFGAPGGDIQVQVDLAELNAENVNLKANGPQTQDGDGGTILVTTSEVVISENTRFKFDADASVNGIGNAQILSPRLSRKAIFFNAGDSELKLGKAKGQVQFTADGGGGDGNGGSIEIISLDQIKIRRDDVASASALGPNGFGGQILLNGDKVKFPSSAANPNGTTLEVDGGMTSGNGGVIQIFANGGTIDVEAMAGGVILSAQAPGDGNGGLIVIDGVNNVNIDSTSINLNAAGNDGIGGNLFISNNKTTTIDGNLTAQGSGNGKGGIVNIDAKNEINLDGGNINVDGGDMNSDGGTVTLTTDKVSAAVNGIKITASAGDNGEGGDVTININGTDETTLGVNDQIFVEGGQTQGPGGEITINTEGKLTLQSDGELNASGLGTGTGGTDSSAGGKITITTQDTFTIDGKLIANSAGDDLAGEIVINAPSIDFTDGEIRADGNIGLIAINGNGPGDFTFNSTGTGVISADNACESSGGGGGCMVAVAAAQQQATQATTRITSEITIDLDGDLVLDNNMIVSQRGIGADSRGGNFIAVGNTVTINSTIDATGNGSGQGGSITLTGLDGVVLDIVAPAQLIADGGSNGKGGSITINTPVSNPLNTLFFNQMLISAVGNGAAEGGDVIIDNFSDTIDIGRVINVDGGEFLVADTKDGSIQLAGQKCQQFRVRTTYPNSYWNCVNFDLPPVIDDAPHELVFGLVPSVKAQLETNGVELFLFNQLSNYNTFFGTGLTTIIGGATDDSPSGDNIWVAVMKNATFTLDEDNLRSVTGHEIGHALDRIRSNESMGTTYKMWAERDFLFLDYTSVGASDETSTRRPPCETGGPFVGVFDETNNGQSICDGTNVRSTYIDQSTGLPFRNSKIAQIATPSLGEGTGGKWEEPYAEGFGFQAHLVPKTEAFFFTHNGLVNNGFLECTQAWATALHDGTAIPPAVPAGQQCATAVPSWYPSLIGQ